MKNFYSVTYKYFSAEKEWTKSEYFEYNFDTFSLEEFSELNIKLLSSQAELNKECIRIQIESISLIHSETQSERTIHRYSSMLEEVKALCTVAELGESSFNERRQLFYDKMMKWSREYHLKRRVV